MDVVEVELEATYDLRRRVLRAHAPEVPLSNPEDTVPGTFHLAVVDDGSVVAIGSFSPQPFPLDDRPAMRLRGMAVEPARQGHGVGALLLRAALERLARDGATTVWANARMPALSFYERHGFVAVGEPFEEIGIEHVRVVRSLGPDLQSVDG